MLTTRGKAQDPKRVQGRVKKSMDISRKHVPPCEEFDCYSNEDLAGLSRVMEPGRFFYLRIETGDGSILWWASDGVQFHDAKDEEDAKRISNFDEESKTIRAQWEDKMEAKRKRKNRQLMVLEEQRKGAGEGEAIGDLKSEVEQLRKDNERLAEENTALQSVQSEIEGLKEQIEEMAKSVADSGAGKTKK